MIDFADCGPWIAVPKFTPAAARLADGHYSRRTIGSPQFMPPGQTLVLLTPDELAVFGWWRPHPASGICGRPQDAIAEAPVTAHIPYCPDWLTPRDHAGPCIDQPGYPMQPPVDPLGLNEQDRAFVERFVRLRTRRRFPSLTIAVGVAMLLTGILIGRAQAAPRSAPAPASASAGGALAQDRIGASQPAVAHGKSTAVGGTADGSEVAGSSPASLGGAPHPSPTASLPTTPSAAHTVRGSASWFCGHGSRCTTGYPGGLYAAAGPALRVGDWRGRQVSVRYGGSVVVVTLIDFCACPQRALDLYRDAFSRLADPSVGLIPVTVTWGDGPQLTAPPTSTK